MARADSSVMRVSDLGGSERQKPCKIQGCPHFATEGLVRRFCKAHYAEFKKEWSELDTTHLTLQNQVELLKRQLKDAGQEAAEYMALDEARGKMQAAVERLMEGERG